VSTSRIQDADGGFSLLELVIVMLILTIVVSVAGTVLFSLSQTATRTDSVVGAEQSASTVLAQMARDIRSGHSLAIPSGTTPSMEVELQVNQPSGGTANVEWIYDSTADTVTRYVQNTGGTFVPSGPAATRVINGSAAGIFSYYYYDGTPLSADYSRCTARIGITLHVGSKVGGVAPFVENEDVALTDQLAALTAPGSGAC
jgi:prepilin-type N-terminal cleavage/methylation domain-containing protein